MSEICQFLAILLIILNVSSPVKAVELPPGTFPASIKVDCSYEDIIEQIQINYPVDLVRGPSIHLFVTEDQYHNLMDEYTEYIDKGDVSVVFLQTHAEAQTNYETIDVYGYGYHTYSSMISELQSHESSNSSICKLYDIGDASGNGNYDILAFKISDNVSTQEDEPAVYLTGGIHGNERLGPEVVMHIAKYIIDNYGSDPEITDLVDNVQLWFVPMANPWGHENNSRTNANGTDLNLAFPTSWGGASANPQSETNAIVNNFLNKHPFVAGVDYHTYGQLPMMPWGHSSQTIADIDALKDLVNDMGNSSGNQTGTISSFFGTVNGGSYDYQYGKYGIFSLGIELGNSHSPSVSQMEQICHNELSAAMMLLKRIRHTTVTGKITHYQTGEPVVAEVKVNGIDSNNDIRNPYKSNETFGSYYRMLEPGSYTFTFQADGFHTQVQNNISVTSSDQTILDVVLVPDNVDPDPDPDQPYVESNEMPTGDDFNRAFPEGFEIEESEVEAKKEVLTRGYPARKNLSVTRRKQERSYWCGPASIQMIQYYYNMPASQSRIASACGTSSNGGTYVYRIVRWLNESPMTGYKKLPKSWKWEYKSLKGYVDFFTKLKWSVGSQNAPQIWHLKTRPSSVYRLPGYTRNYGHYVTGTGYDVNKNTVIYDDPWYGSGGGANREVARYTAWYCIKSNANYIIY